MPQLVTAIKPIQATFSLQVLSLKNVALQVEKCCCMYYQPCCEFWQYVPQSRNEFNFLQHVAATCKMGVIRATNYAFQLAM